MKRLLLAVVLLLLPSVAAAAERWDRPHWSLELKGGAFFPATENWSKFYGSSYLEQFGGALSYKVIRQLELGIAGTYGWATGKGVQPSHGVAAGETDYQQAPLDLFILARGVFDENQLLVPYAGGGYTRMFYRVGVKGQSSTEGSVNGYHARAGLQFLLDRLEPESAENLYNDYGLQHTYFFVEGKYTRAIADTVPSGSVNIGGTSALAGLLVEF